MRLKILLIFLVILLSAGNALGQESEKQSPSQAQGSGEDLAAKTQNPVGAMYSLPFKFTFDYGANNGDATFLNIQPVKHRQSS